MGWATSESGLIVPDEAAPRAPNQAPPGSACQECGTGEGVLLVGRWPCGHTSAACEKCVNSYRLSCPVCVVIPETCHDCGSPLTPSQIGFYAGHRWCCRHGTTYTCRWCKERAEEGMRDIHHRCPKCGQDGELT